MPSFSCRPSRLLIAVAPRAEIAYTCAVGIILLILYTCRSGSHSRRDLPLRGILVQCGLRVGTAVQFLVFCAWNWVISVAAMRGNVTLHNGLSAPRLNIFM
jgi:hypothetical protein